MVNIDDTLLIGIFCFFIGYAIAYGNSIEYRKFYHIRKNKEILQKTVNCKLHKRAK